MITVEGQLLSVEVTCPVTGSPPTTTVTWLVPVASSTTPTVWLQGLDLGVACLEIDVEALLQMP